MGIFDKVLIASDFDGTIANSQSEITKETNDAIKYFISEGGKFTVCTGRTKEGFHNFDKEIMNVPVLVANGAMAFDYEKDEVFMALAMEDKEKCNEVFRKMAEFCPTLGLEFYTVSHKTTCYRTNKMNVEHFDFLKIPFTEINSLDEQEYPVIKALGIAEPKDLKPLQAYLNTIDMGEIEYIPTDFERLELHKRDVNKGTGVLKLAELYGIDKKDVYVIGDGDNDVDMLSLIESFCPENGTEKAKKAASHIVRSNDEGAVINVIEILTERYRCGY